MLLFYCTVQDKTLKFGGEVEDNNIERARRYYYINGYHVEFLRVDEAIQRGLSFA
jgi:hypothetical protein